MVLTTAATVMGVIVLRIHHQGRRGIPVPLYLRRTAQYVSLVLVELALYGDMQVDGGGNAVQVPTHRETAGESE